MQRRTDDPWFGPRPQGWAVPALTLVLLLGLALLTVLVIPDMAGVSAALVAVAALTRGPAAA